MTQEPDIATDGRSVSHGSFTIERIYPVSPQRVFQAFAETSQKRSWFTEAEGLTVLDYALNFEVGGREFGRFKFGDGPEMTFDSLYMDIIPAHRVVNAYSMTAGGVPFSASVSTTELEIVEGGTRMVFTEQCAFLDGKDGLESRKEGSIGLLERLAKHLEGK
jgi:uncharacterized protein YndB with AHSA1/START domain